MYASRAVIDISTERSRQIHSEGWSLEHDDAHQLGEMARAAAAYALPDSDKYEVTGPNTSERILDVLWPWGWSWWKPKDRRRDLVRAGALIVAEIERLDRAEERRAK